MLFADPDYVPWTGPFTELRDSDQQKIYELIMDDFDIVGDDTSGYTVRRTALESGKTQVNITPDDIVFGSYEDATERLQELIQYKILKASQENPKILDELLSDNPPRILDQSGQWGTDIHELTRELGLTDTDIELMERAMFNPQDPPGPGGNRCRLRCWCT